jgi:hypothetical protein
LRHCIPCGFLDTRLIRREVALRLDPKTSPSTGKCDEIQRCTKALIHQKASLVSLPLAGDPSNAHQCLEVSFYFAVRQDGAKIETTKALGHGSKAR